MPDKGPIIKDFDAVAPERRVARIAGREVDVTSIPARVTLAMARFKDELDAGTVSMEDQIMHSIDLVAQAVKPKNPDVTVDWLLDSLTLDQMFEFINFVLNPTIVKAQEYEEKRGNGGPAKLPE